MIGNAAPQRFVLNMSILAESVAKWLKKARYYMVDERATEKANVNRSKKITNNLKAIPASPRDKTGRDTLPISCRGAVWAEHIHI